MAPLLASRCQPGASRLVLGLLCLAVIFSVTLVARECDPAMLSQQPGARPRLPTYNWADHPVKHPVPEGEMVRLPRGKPLRLPKVQHDFSADENLDLRRHIRPSSAEMLQRQQAVKAAFQKAWSAYTQNAWGCDELRPLSMSCANHHNGWGATIVDSLDALWIMGMRDEFRRAVDFVSRIDWSNSTHPRCNPHVANIHYLGGLLSAYDLSQEPVLLNKATELGEVLYAAFDTPSRLPPFAFSFRDLRAGKVVPDPYQSAAALGSLSLEFTRLAQLTGRDRYFDAVDRITRTFAAIQGTTALPGLWPAYIHVRNGFEAPSNLFRIGGDGDSLYEYLPKMHALLGGLDSSYEQMYRRAAAAARNNLLFRPMVPESDESADILFLGAALVEETTGKVAHIAEMEHLACFAGGMFALGGRLISQPDDVEIGERLARGCAWAYASTPSGLMPEKAQLLRCPSVEAPCPWDEERWLLGQSHQDTCPPPQWAERLPRGYWRIDDSRHLLRPEAAESLFVLYRVTGKADLRDTAWDMFRAMERVTATSSGDAFAALADVTWSAEDGAAEQMDDMDVSFLGQTLKYFYLLFSDPDLISLDEWVFNTEAHPFKRPVPA